MSELAAYVVKTVIYLIFATLFVIYASTWMAHPWPMQ